MGANDAKKMLEVAKAEVVRLEARVTEFEEFALAMADATSGPGDITDAEMRERVGAAFTVKAGREARATWDAAQHRIAELEAERDAANENASWAVISADENRERAVALEAVIEQINDWFDDLGDRVLPNGDALARILHNADTGAALREHDAAMVDQLADEYRSGQLTGIFTGRDGYTKAWLHARAAKVRGEADRG